MKFKAMLLVVCAAAGIGASIAVADGGKGNDQGNGEGCRGQHISGTVGPQTFTVTVTKAEGKGSLAPGSTIVVTIGGAGQTVRATVGACMSAQGTTTTTTTATSGLTVRSVDLKAFRTSTTGTNPTGKGEDGQGDHHGHHDTTTTATTTTTHG